jgi:hypothetical protein
LTALNKGVEIIALPHEVPTEAGVLAGHDS